MNLLIKLRPQYTRDPVCVRNANAASHDHCASDTQRVSSHNNTTIVNKGWWACPQEGNMIRHFMVTGESAPHNNITIVNMNGGLVEAMKPQYLVKPIHHQRQQVLHHNSNGWMWTCPTHRKATLLDALHPHGESALHDIHHHLFNMIWWDSQCQKEPSQVAP